MWIKFLWESSNTPPLKIKNCIYFVLTVGKCHNFRDSLKLSFVNISAFTGFGNFKINDKNFHIFHFFHHNFSPMWGGIQAVFRGKIPPSNDGGQSAERIFIAVF
jgi:hypothetical protein